MECQDNADLGLPRRCTERRREARNGVAWLDAMRSRVATDSLTGARLFRLYYSFKGLKIKKPHCQLSLSHTHPQLLHELWSSVGARADFSPQAPEVSGENMVVYARLHT